MVSLKGTVVKGLQRGRIIGFPTANMELISGFESRTLCLGVYVVWVDVRGVRYGGMMNVGVAAEVRDKNGSTGDNIVDDGSAGIGGGAVDDAVGSARNGLNVDGFANIGDAVGSVRNGLNVDGFANIGDTVGSVRNSLNVDGSAGDCSGGVSGDNTVGNVHRDLNVDGSAGDCLGGVSGDSSGGSIGGCSGGGVVCEVNIFDFNENIYGEVITVEVIGKLRDEIKITSLEKLKIQLQQDKQEALDVLNGKFNPAYILEEELLENNLRTVAAVGARAGVEILVALKSFAMWKAFPVFKRFGFSVATASSPNEAALAYEEFGARAHAFSPCYTDKNISDFVKYCSHITFNSLSQYERFRSRLFHHDEPTLQSPISTNNNSATSSHHSKSTDSSHPCEVNLSIGLRVNPEYSEVETELYNPTGKGSRLGIKHEQLPKILPSDIEGLHCHTLCESSAEASAKLIAAFENLYGKYLRTLKWVNFGGGHLMTRKNYDTETLIKALQEFKQRHPHLKIYLEPGSAFTWQTGTLKARIEDIVESDGIKTAILNISFSCHLPDCLEMPYMPEVRGAKIVERDFDAPNVYRLGGNSCLAGDFIGSHQFDHKLQTGEEIIFEDMIHYTMVKTTMFNGLQHPSTVITKNGIPTYFRKFVYADYKPRLA
ncbi:MAG: carboxynorspermidine decarboxylase [Bacteroidales bacterium]|jgi:carboxynorspermidine decarboxylase|nr:carboxynorspermidine decarboxylase [Bacteroidales bacterium]